MKRKITEKQSCFHVNSFSVLNHISAGALLLFLLFMSFENKAQVTPYHYWTFDDAVPLQDQMGRSNLNPGYYQCIYSVNNASNGSAGKFLSLSAANSRAIVATNNLIPDSVITIEFMFKAAPEFNLTEFVRRRDNAILIRIGYPFIQFTTNVKVNGVATSDVQKIELGGIGRASYGYYTDGNWHHMVFKYNGRTGAKEIWVDGQLPAGFSKSVAKGKFDPNTAVPNNNIIDINSNTSYNKLSGSLDEIAFYKEDLPSGMIYKHFTEGSSGQHYTFTATTLTAPSPAPTTGIIDIKEYAPGHPTYSVSAIEQLQTFPTPRYKPAHTLTRNFNWIALDYLSGYQQPGTSLSTAVGTSVNIQKELAGNWNYFLLVSSNTSNYTSYNDPAKFHGAWVKLANQNPQWGASAISFWNQLNPTTAGYTSNVGYVENKSLPSTYYLRNSSGQYLNTTGSVTTSKYLSPAAPLDSFYNDAYTQRNYFQSLVSALTRPLDIISENGEVIPKLNNTAMSLDPYVTQDKNSSGLDWETYQGNRKMRLAKLYSSKFLSLPQLANTYYSEYQISGHNTRHKYSQTRYIQKDKNGQYYATPDFYPRWPGNWQTGTGAWNGWQHIIDGRNVELNLGDKLFSPYVAAGWNGDEERNIRPAQWLGLMKALAGLGAEFYYTGYFNEANSYTAPNPPPNNPSGYVWQAVVPSYAQAVTSRFEDLLRDGTLLPGDMPNNYSSPTSPGYSFYSGDLRKLVIIRKDNSTDRYAICSTIQPNSNYSGNAELEGDAKINLNGKSLQFKVRRQGSTYIYDNSNPQSPVFYQLDGWHESSHPFYWSKDFNFEAELHDNTTANTRLITRVPSGTASGDFRNYVTAVQVASSTMPMPVLEYKFTPRNQPAYYFWIKARSTDGTSAGIQVGIDQLTAKTIGCITDTAWKWYSIESCNATAINFTGLTNSEHTLKLIPNSANIEIDAILLTTDMHLNLNTNQPACGASLVNVTSNGSLTVCNGKSVTLTAPASISYTWSNGATTQSIIVNTPGNFSVSVNQGGVCNSISQPVNITALTNPEPIISGTNSFCNGDSAMISASGGIYSYHWSEGSTTADIIITQGGTYMVTATDKNGCSATRTVSLTENPLPMPVITAGTNDLAVIPSIKLTASGGVAYTWQPGGSTGSILNATTPGAYTVTATSNEGCTATSQPFNIILSTHVSIEDSTPLHFCSGQKLTINAKGATNYLWSPGGETSASIEVDSPGKYIVHGIDGTGNIINSDSIEVKMFPSPMQPFISMTYVPENAYQLIASEPSAITYNWSTGATTQALTFTAAANVSVTATNAFGCISTPVTIQVANPAISGCMTPDMLIYSEASDTSVILQWNPAVQANQFVLRYWKNGSAVINEILIPGNVNQKRINGLSGGTLYSWTVESQCNSGSFLSQTSTFNTLNMTLSCGSKPMHLFTSDIQLKSANLNWYSTEADSFMLRYRVVGATTYNYMQLSNSAIKGAALTGLTAATTYEWQVLSFCSGYSSAYTTSGYFTTTNNCGYMGDLSTIQIRTNGVTLKWTNTTPMDSVRIQITNVITGSKKIVKLEYNPSSGTYRVNGLQANTKYYAEVRGTCSNGVAGAWTQPLYFTTPAANLRDNAPLRLNGYPNPATTHLSYSFESESDTAYTIRVCDMSGRQLMQEVRQAQNGTSTDEIPVSIYSKGIYLLIITQGTMTGQFRFSVQ